MLELNTHVESELKLPYWVAKLKGFGILKFK